MEIKATLFAITIISMVVIASAIVVNQWSDIYGSGVTSDLGAFDKLSEVSSEADIQKGKINPQSGEASSDFETETFRGAYGILTNIFAPLRIVFGEGGMIDAITDRIGLPDYIRQVLVTLFIVALTALIIAVVFRRAQDKV